MAGGSDDLVFIFAFHTIVVKWHCDKVLFYLNPASGLLN